MYTDEQQLHAIELIRKYKGNIYKAWKMLEYPESLTTLKLWYRNYLEDENKIVKLPRYSDSEIDKAVNYYLERAHSSIEGALY